MGERVEIECLWPTDLEEAGYEYQSPEDKYRNAIILPQDVMDDLGVTQFGYVEATPTSGPHREEKTILQALSFQSTPDRAGELRASLRTNLMDNVGITPDDSTVAIRNHVVSQTRPIPNYAGYSDDVTGYDICYLGAGERDEIGIGVGEAVEVYNPDTGGRFPLSVRELRQHEPNRKMRMSGQARNVLQRTTGDEVVVRKPVHARPASYSATEQILNHIVGFRQLGLRVSAGRDRDEHRNAVRLSPDVMELIAVEPGDQVILEWNNQKTSVRCLEPVDDDLDSMTIKIPSTVRDRLDVSIYDAIHVRRNMGYKFQQQIALSTLGIIGVFVGSIQASIYVGLAPSQMIPMIVLLSILVVWLLLLPERRRCGRGV